MLWQGWVYCAFLLFIFWLVPGNPDPVDVPAELFLRFNKRIAYRPPVDLGIDGGGVRISAEERQSVTSS